MNHPRDLLVDLVDGSISSDDRAVVDAHLASCTGCRRDVELAAAGRDALRRIPDPVVPPGLGDAAVEEAERRAREVAPEVSPLRRGGRAEVPGWYRWAGAAAAAAAVLLVLVVALPNVGQDDRTAGSEAATDARADSSPAVARGVEVQDVDYDEETIQQLALGYRSAAAAGGQPGTAYSGEAAPAADLAAVDDVLTCVRHGMPSALADQEPARLIEARFEGTPAYLGVFLSGPGAGRPPDVATVWIVARDGCDSLSSAVASL